MVQRTADHQARGATVRRYSKDVENGRVEYEVHLADSGHNRDVRIANDGTLIAIEEQVIIDSQVRSGSIVKAASGRILRAESLTKHGKIVAYEAQLQKAGQKTEVQVGPDE